MMKKLFFFVAAAMCATSMWAVDVTPVDSVPVPRYIRNITVDFEQNKLSFRDVFREGAQLQRKYKIFAYERTNSTSLVKVRSQEEVVWTYGDPTLINPTFFIDNPEHNPSKIDFMEVQESKNMGGTVEFESTCMRTLLSMGYTEIHLVIMGTYYDEISYTYEAYHTCAAEDNMQLYMDQFVDVSIPKLLTLNVSTPTSTVKYSESLQINCEIQASSNTFLKFWWYDAETSQYNEVYSYMLSAEEARQGATVSYTKSFWDDDVKATRDYVVAAYVDGVLLATRETTIHFQYPLVINSGTPTFYGAGETVDIAKNTCTEYTARTLNNVPVSMEDLGSTCRLTMPACELWLTSKTKEFTVQFRDYDNTVLKTEKVSCGSDATPPTPPTHTGMSFVEWDKSYTNIQSNQVIRARYKYEGIEAELTCARAVAMQGEEVTFNVRVKTPTSIAVRAFLDAAWIDSENDEVNFGSAVSSVDFTADEAVAGTTKSLEVTVSPTGSLNQGHHARYFRLRIRLSGSTKDYEFNIVRVDTYYPIVISGDAAVISYLADGTRLTAGNGGTIYSRPQDTIYAVSGITACSLKFQWQSISQGVDAGDYWVVVPEESGANMLTISREKHTVVFFMSEHHDGYWENLYGSGAYEPQEIFCGGVATPPDIIAEVPEGKLFRGWKARGEYADDAYNMVVQDMEFDALLENDPQSIEEIPVPQEKARKYLINGAIYIVLPDGKVYNIQGQVVR